MNIYIYVHVASFRRREEMYIRFHFTSSDLFLHYTQPFSKAPTHLRICHITLPGIGAEILIAKLSDILLVHRNRVVLAAEAQRLLVREVRLIARSQGGGRRHHALVVPARAVAIRSSRHPRWAQAGAKP